MEFHAVIKAARKKVARFPLVENEITSLIVLTVCSAYNVTVGLTYDNHM